MEAGQEFICQLIIEAFFFSTRLMFGHPSVSHRKTLVTDSVESSTLLGQTLEEIDALV